MRLWSESFAEGGSLPARLAFAALNGGAEPALSSNRNPHLAWDEVPAGTESLVLLCIDGDAPTDGRDVNQPGRTLPFAMPRSDFFHWSLIDIPLGLGGIAEGALSSAVTPGGKPGPEVSLVSAGQTFALRQGVNDYTGWFAADPAMAGDYYGYDGPCPPWNDLRRHHYIFRLYALDLARLPLQGRFGCADVIAAIQGHIIDEAQIIGSYTLNPTL